MQKGAATLMHRRITAKRKSAVLFALPVAILLAGVITYFWCSPDQTVLVNNTEPAEKIVSQRYDDFLLLQMEADYETYQTLTLSELEKAYHIKLECKRKTETDEYYVLVSERGGKAFIFTAHGLVSYIFFLRHALYSDELMGAVHLLRKKMCFYPPALSAEVSSYGGNTISKVYVVEDGFLAVDYGLVTGLWERGPVLKTRFYSADEYSNIISKCMNEILAIDTQGLPLQHLPEPLG